MEKTFGKICESGESLNQWGYTMKITIEEVQYIAELARLRLDDKEKKNFAKQLGQILNYIDVLSKIDTSSIKPTSHILPVENIFREDEVKDSLPGDEILMNAPDKEDGFFKVKKII